MRNVISLEKNTRKFYGYLSVLKDKSKKMVLMAFETLRTEREHFQ